MNTNQYTLVLPSWFPSSVDLYNGDFNERMVKAYSMRVNSIVLYIVGDLNIKKRRIVIQNKHQYKVITVFYPRWSLGFLGTVVNFLNYVYYGLLFGNLLIKKFGKPVYVHCFVFFPAGLISWYLAKRYRLNHILTEHWTIFYQSMPNNVHKANVFVKYFIKKLISSFALIFPVASALKLEMLSFAPNGKYMVIPNVVDGRLFFFDNRQKPQKFVFVHASTLGYQKNPQLLLKAFENALIQKCDASLKLIGPISEELIFFIEKSDLLKKNIQIMGELSHEKVSEEMKKAHCLVLSSRFENLPCVILEALCCGLLIISTNVGGVSEVVNESNGILIPENNEDELTNAYINIRKKYDGYDHEQIAKNAINKFNYQQNAEMLQDALKKNKII